MIFFSSVAGNGEYLSIVSKNLTWEGAPCGVKTVVIADTDISKMN